MLNATQLAPSDPISELEPDPDVLNLEERAATRQPAISRDTSLLFAVHSDLLSLQQKLEEAKLDLARLRLNMARENYRFEKEISTKEEERETKKAKASEHMADLTVYNNAPHDNYRASASTQFRDRTNEAAKLQEQIHKSRVGQQLKLELRKIWLARQEVRQARMSLELIKINVRVGEVTCPVKCKVIRVYAIPNQFVTKGDPIAEVQLLE